MDFWSKARSFAEEATKRTQELTQEAAKRSHDLTVAGAPKFSEIISETTRRSKEIAAKASKRVNQIKAEAIKRADQIKHLAEGIPPPSALFPPESPPGAQKTDLETFGVTEELREFMKEITSSTFRDFPLEDDTELSDVPTVSNVRQDLTEWQEKHASLVLSTVKEISKLRYELCPRVMKERKFWRIYFILVSSHIALYEKRYAGDIKLKSSQQVKDDKTLDPKEVGLNSKPEARDIKKENNVSTSSKDQDLDVFLLGDLEDSDGSPDDGDALLDDDFDKMIAGSDDDEKGKS